MENPDRFIPVTRVGLKWTNVGETTDTQLCDMEALKPGLEQIMAAHVANQSDMQEAILFFSSWQKETNIPICRQLCLSDFTCLSAYLEPTQNNDRLWKFFHVLPICTFVAYLMHWRFQVCSKSTSSNCTPKLPFYYREFMMIIHWILGDDITLLNLLTNELR